MVSSVATALACCFCCGVAEYVRRQRAARMFGNDQRYKALSTMDATNDDEDDDDYDGFDTELPEPSLPELSKREPIADPNLMDFSSTSLPVTPGPSAGRPSVLSASRCVPCPNAGEPAILSAREALTLAPATRHSPAPSLHDCARACFAVCSCVSASWVDEMNAELAEFDALTATTLDESRGAGWEFAMDDELQNKLATPRRR